MSTEQDVVDYIHCLQKDSDNDANRSASLLSSGAITKIASFIDNQRKGIHVDVNGQVGGLATVISAQTQRKVIALMRNPYNAERAAKMMLEIQMPTEPHVHINVLHAAQQPLQVQYPICLQELQDIDMQNNNAVTLLCDDIRRRRVLDSVLNLRPVDSVSWTFPTYNIQVAMEEYPNTGPMHAAMHMATADREHIMRYATQFVNPGGQFIVAGDATIHPNQPNADAEGLRHIALERMKHWKDYWEPGDAFCMRNMQGAPIEFIGQNGSYNGFSITELRRNAKKVDRNALEASDTLLGVR